MEPELPLEFVVEGVPVSLQAKRPATRERWKKNVQDCARPHLPEGNWLLQGPVAITICYFPEERLIGDVDNYVKPILDALCRFIIKDDNQVERLVVERFNADRVYKFDNPSVALAEAADFSGSCVYVKVEHSGQGAVA